MTTYYVGDKVWIRVEGYPWWPGRIVTSEELGQDVAEGHLAAKFFETEDAIIAPLSDFTPLETDSEKARVPEIQRALAIALGGDVPLPPPLADTTSAPAPAPQSMTLDMDGDEMAMLLETDVTHTSVERDDNGPSSPPPELKEKKSKKDKHDKKEKKDKKDKKRDRAESEEEEPKRRKTTTTEPPLAKTKTPHPKRRDTAPPPVNQRAPSPVKESGRRTATNIQDNRPVVASNEEVRGIGADINAILAARPVNIPALRSLLIRLSTLTLDIFVLRQTSIGCDLMAVHVHVECQRVRALVKALLVSWVGCLPEEMRQALRNVGDLEGVSNQQQQHQPLPVVGGGVSQTPKDWHTAIRDKFAEHLGLDLATAVEKALFETSNTPRPQFKALESALSRNQVLREDVVAGRITPEVFVQMTGKELLSEAELNALAAMRESVTQQLLWDSAEAHGAVTERFPCEACGHEQCTFYQQQMRSADEPPTMFLTCLKCKHSFRVD